MNKLTLKTFLADLIITYVSLIGLAIIFDFLLSYAGHVRFKSVEGFFQAEGLIIPGYLSYCILFYHLFFKRSCSRVFGENTCCSCCC